MQLKVTKKKTRKMIKFLKNYYIIIIVIVLFVGVYFYGLLKEKSMINHLRITKGRIKCVNCGSGKTKSIFSFRYFVNDTFYIGSNTYNDNSCFSDSCMQKEYEVAYDSIDPTNAIFIWDSVQKQEILEKMEK